MCIGVLISIYYIILGALKVVGVDKHEEQIKLARTAAVEVKDDSLHYHFEDLLTTKSALEGTSLYIIKKDITS